MLNAYILSLRLLMLLADIVNSLFSIFAFRSGCIPAKSAKCYSIPWLKTCEMLKIYFSWLCNYWDRQEPQAKFINLAVLSQRKPKPGKFNLNFSCFFAFQQAQKTIEIPFFLGKKEEESKIFSRVEFSLHLMICLSLWPRNNWLRRVRSYVHEECLSSTKEAFKVYKT